MRVASAMLIAAAFALPLLAQSDSIQAKLDAIAPLWATRPLMYATIESTPDGKPRLIVAGFTTDDESESKLIAYRVERSGALTPLASLALHDVIHNMEARDATGDGKPEVLVTGDYGNRSAALDVISWNGKALKLIGETSDHASFEDIDGDGSFEVVERGSNHQRNECDYLIDAVYVGRFTPSGIDQISTAIMLVQATPMEPARAGIGLADDAPLRCHLHIVNGTRAGAHRASAVRLKIDGKRVPIRLTAADATVDTDITLPSRCVGFDITPTGGEDATVVAIFTSPKKKGKK